VKVEGERDWDGLVKVVWDVCVVEGEAESVPDVFVDAVEFVAWWVGGVRSADEVKGANKLWGSKVECHLIPFGVVFAEVSGGIVRWDTDEWTEFVVTAEIVYVGPETARAYGSLGAVFEMLDIPSDVVVALGAGYVVVRFEEVDLHEVPALSIVFERLVADEEEFVAGALGAGPEVR
jgi:hypothetical protein